jgi:hypothetical protein
LGKRVDDDPGADFFAGDCAAGGTGSKYTLMPLLRLASFLAFPILDPHEEIPRQSRDTLLECR